MATTGGGCGGGDDHGSSRNGSRSFMRRILSPTFHRASREKQQHRQRVSRSASPLMTVARHIGQQMLSSSSGDSEDDIHDAIHARIRNKTATAAATDETTTKTPVARQNSNKGKVTPPRSDLEQIPCLLLRFTKKATPKLIRLVSKRWQKCGLHVLHSQFDATSQTTYVYLSAEHAAIETLAEQVRVMKRTVDGTNVVDYFTVRDKRLYTRPSYPPAAFEDGAPITVGADPLFTANEWCDLAFRLLDSIEVWLEGETSSELNLLLMLSDKANQPTKEEQLALQLAEQEQIRLEQQLRRSRSSVNMEMLQSSWNVMNKSLRDGISYRNHGGSGGAVGRNSSFGSFGNNHSSSSNNSSSSLDRRSHHMHNRRASFHKRRSMKLQRVKAHGKRSSCLRHVLQANEFIDICTTVHVPHPRDHILKQTWYIWRLVPPVHDIRAYYGEDIAFYFAWMGFLLQWLVFPGIMGLFMTVFRWYREDTIDEDEYTPFYGLTIFLWAILFLRFWQRHEHRLAYAWGTYSLSPYERTKFFAQRPEFRGVLRKSPITGEYETFYPANARRMHYLVSGLVTAFMLTIAFGVMILSLNMQGYIHPERNPERWNQHNPHPFHFPQLAVLSESNHIFDSAASGFRMYLPTVVHVAAIFTLNNIYRTIATKLTDWENHETEASYRSSLILKRFLFEAFDCYVALFYLAFYERDVERLRLELVTVFNIDTFRRMMLECFLPMIQQTLMKWANQRQPKNVPNAVDLSSDAFTPSGNLNLNDMVTNSKDDNTESSIRPLDDSKSSFEQSLIPEESHMSSLSDASERLDESDARTGEKHTKQNDKSCKVTVNNQEKNPYIPSYEEMVEEADKDEYEAFDDYMEIVIQFGYVTLFASAYPLASLVALVANWVEIRTDCYKLTRLCRRPRSYRATGIGMWKSLLSCVVWMSALTNCLIVGFTSDQMMQIFPTFYVHDNHGDTHLVHDKGWIAVFVIFGLERVLLLIGLLIYAIVPEVPEDVRDEVERLHYIRSKEHDEVMKQMMKKRSGRSTIKKSN